MFISVSRSFMAINKMCTLPSSGALDEENDDWSYIPETLLLEIFSFLTVEEVCIARRVCSRWNQLAQDELLWKKYFYRDFHIDRSIDKATVELSWYHEYRRLTEDVPIVLTETLETHSNQVLHVTFSNDGTMFSTSSKDGTVVVWDATTYPCISKYSHDMTTLSWKHPQFSQFNCSDTLLLVSGIHFGSPHNTSGEIAVFTVQNEFELQCRVVNKPYDVFGCWLDEKRLISGDLHWLAHLTSVSALWINRASQEPQSELVPVIAPLYRLYNAAASSVRTVMVADDKVRDKTRLDAETYTECHFDFSELTKDELRIQYLPQYYSQYEGNEETSSGTDSSKAESECTSETNEQTDSESSYSSETLIDKKLLIYTSGRATYVPHLINFKYIENFQFPKHIEPGLPIKERLAARQREKQREKDGENGPDWSNYETVKHMFDEPDRVIDLRGHIIGMTITPDHKYLYINVRMWPSGYFPDNPLDPPPISLLVYLHVIDLSSLQLVGLMSRPVRPFAHNMECYFVFLDASYHYVASGAIDHQAYIWERHYGVALARLQHNDVVNGVAFCPTSNILVTVSDDYSIRVWRSKSAVRKLGLQGRQKTEGYRYHRGRPCLLCD